MCESHKWIVFSTVLQQHVLLLQCLDCGLLGTVQDPTEKEWVEAYWSPWRPYQWTVNERVTPSQPTEMFVIPATKHWRCDCCKSHKPPRYERFPREIMRVRAYETTKREKAD